MPAFLNLSKKKFINKVVEIDINKIHPNPNQPRSEFSDDELLTLAQSIEHNGILQPLSVRFVDDNYELIAGERRLRAAGGLCRLRG